MRLSEEEYERVKKICRERRIRTISEFTRIAVAHEIMAYATEGTGAPATSNALDVSMERLSDSMERLVRAIESVTSEFRVKPERDWEVGS